MGAINYGRNCPKEGFINIGLNLGRFSSPLTIMRRVSMMQEIIDEYKGGLFIVRLEPGYYEGAWVSIKWDEDILFYNSHWSSKEVRDEIGLLNDMLEALVGVGCVEYFPGWCPRYSNAAKTRLAIKDSCKKLYNYYQEVYQEEEGDD